MLSRKIVGERRIFRKRERLSEDGRIVMKIDMDS